MMTAANDTAPAAVSPRAAAIVTVWEIRSPDRKIQGRVYVGTVVTGHSAQITPGVSIRLFGVETRGIGVHREEIPYCRDFAVGDFAVCGGYNLTHTGRIRSITAKTVTVVEREGSNGERVHRMSLCDFDASNWDFNEEEVARRNAAWSD